MGPVKNKQKQLTRVSCFSMRFKDTESDNIVQYDYFKGIISYFLLE
jgi:hypothetical protein